MLSEECSNDEDDHAARGISNSVWKGIWKMSIPGKLNTFYGEPVQLLCARNQTWWNEESLRRTHANSVQRNMKPSHTPCGKVSCCIRCGIRNLIGWIDPRFHVDPSRNLWEWSKLNLNPWTSSPQRLGPSGVGEIRLGSMNQLCPSKKLQRKPTIISLPTSLGIALCRRNNPNQGLDGTLLHLASIRQILMVLCVGRNRGSRNWGGD